MAGPAAPLPVEPAGGRAAGPPRPFVVPRSHASDVLFESLRTLSANLLTLAGFVITVILVATAVLVEVLPPITHTLLGHSWSILPYSPSTIGPGLNEAPSAQHWFGTDELGRDVLSRVVAALPLDLTIGIVITGLSILIGAGLGLIAGFWEEGRVGRSASAVILRVTDIFLAFPTLVLAIALTAIFGHSVDPLTAIVIALTVTWWPYYVRIVRGEVLVIKHQGYIHAGRIAGLSEGRILVRHVLRNLLEPLTVYATLDVGTVIVTFSTVAFVIPLPSTILEWGTMVSNYQSLLPGEWWLVMGPGLAIFVTVLGLSLLGDGLRDVLDPRTRRAFAKETESSFAPRPSASSGEASE
ncbi:MAG TPA: ABC transporter permease [Thermoplasmata archaeon]|nr:ABC transporter permease [Thermoplasmata archaeon]